MADPSTSPISPTSSSTSSEHDIQTLLLAQINQLSQHHVTVSYTLIAILVLVLGLAGMGGWLGLKSYEAQVSRAEVIEAKYMDAQKAFSEQLAANNAERAQDAQASAALIAQIAKRAVAPLPPVVQSGLAASASAPGDAIKALQSVLPALGTLEVIPVPVNDPRPLSSVPQVGLTVPQTQILIQTKLDLDRTTADLGDTGSLLTLANRDKGTLTDDLNTCNLTLSKANDTLKAYKAIAVKSKWRKFLDGAFKVSLVLGGVAVGHGI